jgi:rhodanese-related sulfurtransferase
VSLGVHEGAMGNCFLGHGLQIDGIVFLAPREALPFLEGEAVLVDLRLDREKSGREFQVTTVLALPFPELVAKLSTLPRDRPLIVADSVGVNSKEAARLLMDHGYERDEELVGSCTCRLKPRKHYRGGSAC